MQYRREKTQGATYFFTLVTHQRIPFFKTQEDIASLRQAFRQEMTRRPFTIDAIVILPDHIHAIWTLPPDDADFSMRWRNIKRAFTANIPPEQRPEPFSSRRKKHEQAMWQRRFWEHRIRDERDFNNHVDYIHYNPVKHGYCNKPADWVHSSIHRYIRQEILTADWGASIQLPEGIGQE